MEKTTYLQMKALELKVRKELKKYDWHLKNVVFCRFTGQVSKQI